MLLILSQLVLYWTLLLCPPRQAGGWIQTEVVNGLGGPILVRLPENFNSTAERSLLHISRHAGCIRDIFTVTDYLGIKSEIIHFRGPYKLTKDYANEDWRQNHEYYNRFDYILTTDTTVLSRIFLQNLDELRGHLVIYVSNRFDNSHEDDVEFRELFKNVAVARRDRVTIVPFCEFEKVYLLAKGIDISHFPVILPLGDWTPATNSMLNLDWEEEMYGPVGDRWAGRGVTKSLDMFDTYYVNHYQNEQDNNIAGKCRDHGLKCFLGYADSVAAFKAMVVLPSQACNIAPYDAIVRGFVAFVPTKRLLNELALRKVPGYTNYAFHFTGINNATEYCSWLSYPECRIFYDSFDSLFEQMKTLEMKTVLQIRNQCAMTVSRHRSEVLRQWRRVFNITF